MAHITIGDVSHSVPLQIGHHSYSASTLLAQDGHTLTIKADSGAFSEMHYTPTSMTITGGDKAGRRFTLTLTTTQHGMTGRLQVGGQTFTAQGPAKQIMAKLVEQVKNDSSVQNQLPDGDGLTPLGEEMQKNEQLVAVLAGRPPIPVALQRRKTYCESVCACCEKGSWLSAWCCLSCASCDYFEVQLTPAVNFIAQP